MVKMHRMKRRSLLGYCVAMVTMTMVTLCVLVRQDVEETDSALVPGGHARYRSDTPGESKKHRFTKTPAAETKQSRNILQSEINLTRTISAEPRGPKKQWESLTLPKGLKWNSQLREARGVISENITDAEAEKLYLQVTAVEPLECRERRRLGNVVDGGWDICTVGPYRPRTSPHRCLVYSFGVNFDWSFEDAVQDEFACEVRSFDPSMGLARHEHSVGVRFYPWGLGPDNSEVDMGRAGRWPLRTLGTILTELGDTERVLDYLKLDIEAWEWGALETMFLEGVLGRVKQLGIELHTKDPVTGGLATARPHTARYLRVLARLHALGFRKWYTHYNMFGIHKSETSGDFITCCIEAVYVNLNFLDPNYLTGGLPPLNLTQQLPMSPGVDRPHPYPPTPEPSHRFPGFGLQPRTSKWAVELTYGFSQAEAERVFYEYFAENRISCPQSETVGDEADTGWSLCTAPPFNLSHSCLVYSLSYSLDWAFERDVWDRFQCECWFIKTRLDDAGNILRRKEMPMHLISLGEKRTDKLYKSFWNVLVHNQHVKTTIDLLRVDVDSQEWDFLTTLLNDGSLAYIKQLVVDVHTREAVSVQHDPHSDSWPPPGPRGSFTSVADFVLYLSVLNNLERAGFQLWRTADINMGLYRSARTRLMRPCCLRLHYLNTRFLR